MSETPLPSMLLDEPDVGAGGASESQKRKRSTPPQRPVSAFAPANNTAQAESGVTASHSATAEDLAFAAALREAGLATDLAGAELLRASRGIRHEDPPARRIDLLAAYYTAAGDPIASQRRKATDRWFLYASEQGVTAAELVMLLHAVVPELPDARLERIGGSLMLRTGEHVCALDDEHDEERDVPFVSVRELVRAFNVLLERHSERVRLVGLVGDGRREAYLGLSSLGMATLLAQADYLEAETPKSLRQLTGW